MASVPECGPAVVAPSSRTVAGGDASGCRRSDRYGVVGLGPARARDGPAAIVASHPGRPAAGSARCGQHRGRARARDGRGTPRADGASRRGGVPQGRFSGAAQPRKAPPAGGRSTRPVAAAFGRGAGRASSLRGLRPGHGHRRGQPARRATWRHDESVACGARHMTSQDTSEELQPSLPARVLITIVGLYQRTAALRAPRCRFYPTCSQYAIDSVRLHGAARGGLYALARVARCHPWHEGGVDPVKPRKS